MDLYSVIKRAVLTEKSTFVKDLSNQYVFDVDRRANKIEIAQAVEKLFKVKVLNVRTMKVHGKKKRLGRIIGEKPDWKKAVVTLAPGNRIEIYEGV
ncbi:MAG TPA: 50S ribosomal protein L23 [Syntrophales bacterium]|nr:50S ribosomal protein L23 [Syntrophales bacterium]HOM06769.1 50S ribosomal protein L23 [Syntrophales bacterium]HON99536.1 50S ribosomal protein L23 [Syntrophales bacterium]HPC00729.1 50S ribosomal protein L23 [Syntrophales bacterium]HPQ06073.1 50S ribosomal protein L23 [Syntrophales bacterium]